MASDAIYALIMAGGSGTRFWPASRRTRPKQLLQLAGEQELIRATVDRVAPLCGEKRVLISTGTHLLSQTMTVLPEIAREQMLVEPLARNTAPCIGWAAAAVARKDPDAVLLALPADHHIADVDSYRSLLRRAVAAAREGRVTTIGVRPTRAETGYGYIESEPGDAPLRTVRRFIEKPDRPRAEQFLASDDFFWNAGMFVFRARDMLAAIEAHMPELASCLAELDEAAARGAEDDVLERVFERMPSTSIDYGVMEKLDHMAMVVGDFGWSDVGSWLAAAELSHTDPAGNSAPAGSVLIDAQRNHVVDLRREPTTRVTALLGVSDLVVVQTDDALLVARKSEAQRVREIVAALKERGDDELV